MGLRAITVERLKTIAGRFKQRGWVGGSYATLIAVSVG
jgi:hypothetical protein